MKVTTEIYFLEVDGKKVEGTRRYQEKAIVKSHWDNVDLVILEIGGKEYTLNANQLKRAINNSINWKIK